MLIPPLYRGYFVMIQPMRAEPGYYLWRGGGASFLLQHHLEQGVGPEDCGEDGREMLPVLFLLLRSGSHQRAAHGEGVLWSVQGTETENPRVPG